MKELRNNGRNFSDIDSYSGFNSAGNFFRVQCGVCFQSSAAQMALRVRGRTIRGATGPGSAENQRIFFGTRDYVYGLTVLFELWLLLMIALADQKYMVVPDQFVIFLALFAFPMSIYKETFQDMVYGFLLGIGVMLLAAFFGRLVMRREALGFGDVKLMGAIGLSAGLSGTAFILIAASLLSCAGFLYGIAKGRLKEEDAVPLAPYLALATAVYFFFY